MHKIYCELKGFSVFEMHGYSNIEDFCTAKQTEDIIEPKDGDGRFIGYDSGCGIASGPRYYIIENILSNNSFIAEEANA